MNEELKEQVIELCEEAQGLSFEKAEKENNLSYFVLTGMLEVLVYEKPMVADEIVELLKKYNIEILRW